MGRGRESRTQAGAVIRSSVAHGFITLPLGFQPGSDYLSVTTTWAQRPHTLTDNSFERALEVLNRGA